MPGTYGSGSYGQGDYGPTFGGLNLTPSAACYHISQLIGTGGPSDPWRVRADDYGVNYAAVIPAAPSGAPANPTALVWTNPSTVGLDQDVYTLPKVALDTQLGLDAAGRSALQAQLSQMGVLLPITTSTTLRQVVNAVIDVQVGPTASGAAMGAG